MNVDGDIVIVKKIDGTIHRHNSGREFTDEEIETLNARVGVSFVEVVPEMTIEDARSAYKEKYEKPVAICKKNDLNWLLWKLK